MCNQDWLPGKGSQCAWGYDSLVWCLVQVEHWYLVSGSTQISAGQELGCAKRNHEL